MQTGKRGECKSLSTRISIPILIMLQVLEEPQELKEARARLLSFQVENSTGLETVGALWILGMLGVLCGARYPCGRTERFDGYLNLLRILFGSALFVL